VDSSFPMPVGVGAGSTTWVLGHRQNEKVRKLLSPVRRVRLQLGHMLEDYVQIASSSLAAEPRTSALPLLAGVSTFFLENKSGSLTLPSFGSDPAVMAVVRVGPGAPVMIPDHFDLSMVPLRLTNRRIRQTLPPSAAVNGISRALHGSGSCVGNMRVIFYCPIVTSTAVFW